MRLSFRFASALGVVAVAAAVGAPAGAQGFPNRPVRIVVPFAAGGGVDILTRTLAQHLGERLGQQVLVDDKPGAGGNLGVDAVAKAPADGYTLLMATTGTHTINPGLYALITALGSGAVGAFITSRAEIADAMGHPSTDDLKIAELKRKKLLVKDEIERLRIGDRQPSLH